MLLQISPDWITDDRTKRQYLVLDIDHLRYDELKQQCHNHGAILPEPRNETQNLFLDKLGSHKFALGMTDRVEEGTWVWESDGTPVTWFKWWGNYHPNEPDGGSAENCAFMFSIGYGPWLDYNCSKPRHKPRQGARNSLVCQRNIGMWTLSNV